MSSGETVPLQRDEERSSAFVLVHITAIVRTWGLLTSIVMWVAAILMIDNHERGFVVFYLIGVAIVVSFLEITWLLNKCACCGQEGCCCRVWRAIMWIDNWKKFIIYVGLSVPLFLEGKKEAFGIVTGFMLIILSTMYLVKTFQGHQVTVTRHQRIEKSQITSGVTSISRQVVTHENWTQTDIDGQPVATP